MGKSPRAGQSGEPGIPASAGSEVPGEIGVNSVSIMEILSQGGCHQLASFPETIYRNAFGFARNWPPAENRCAGCIDCAGSEQERGHFRAILRAAVPFRR
jgi:hypothetical protein